MYIMSAYDVFFFPGKRGIQTTLDLLVKPFRIMMYKSCK